MARKSRRFRRKSRRRQRGGADTEKKIDLKKKIKSALNTTKDVNTSNIMFELRDKDPRYTEWPGKIGRDQSSSRAHFDGFKVKDVGELKESKLRMVKAALTQTRSGKSTENGEALDKHTIVSILAAEAPFDIISWDEADTPDPAAKAKAAADAAAKAAPGSEGPETLEECKKEVWRLRAALPSEGGFRRRRKSRRKSRKRSKSQRGGKRRSRRRRKSRRRRRR